MHIMASMETMSAAIVTTTTDITTTEVAPACGYATGPDTGDKVTVEMAVQ